MALLDGKKILVTGVLTDASIAFAVADLAIQQGAQIALSNAGRTVSLMTRVARKLPADDIPMLELDVTDPEQVAALAPALREAGWDHLDGVVHSIAYGPPATLGNGMFAATWDDVATAIHISAYSLRALTDAALPLMGPGGSIVGFTFDASLAWPAYDWMGVAKAALESTSRYLARDLGPKGIRVNQIAAGPIRSMAAKSIPGFSAFEDVWGERAPLGWDIADAYPVARSTVALLSDWFPATTGEIIHVDGGFHAIGA
ncbi:MAG: meromycolic acid enoyl-[acyl-carrier-protein] reductase [Actinomycetota bacterium]|jgi:enoyl-[acyl-carrier protein] reductase I|nr:meromycolic acid enoyl-[acyl-carrier-protein] reductase [Actinomycetota bacterium]